MSTERVSVERMRCARVVLGFVLVLVALPALRAHAQSCCGKLDVPLATTERAANRMHQLLAGLAYEFGLSNDGFTEQGFGLETSEAHTLTLDASYGVTDWLTPTFAVPFVYKHYRALVGGESVARHVLGVGDALLLAKFGILGTRTFAPGALRMWLAPGVKLPTGTYRHDDEYGRLPASAQLGSGSFDAVAAAFASIGLTGPGSKNLLMLNVVARITTENSEGYRAGHSIESTLFITAAQIDRLGLRIGPQLRFGMRDRQAGMQLANTGATRLSARAGGAFSLDDTISLTADVQVPLYSRVHGDQLDPLLAAAFGLLVTYP
jgi:hypothetical protein